MTILNFKIFKTEDFNNLISKTLASNNKILIKIICLSNLEVFNKISKIILTINLEHKIKQH